MEHTQTKFESMATANSQLSAKVAELSQKLASRNWQDFKHPAQHVEKTCVLGSSIIRDIDHEKLENTDVISVSEGKIPTIHKKLNDLSCDYRHIVIMVGGNDCAESSERPVSDLLQDYRRLVMMPRNESEKLCNKITCDICKDFFKRGVIPNSLKTQNVTGTPLSHSWLIKRSDPDLLALNLNLEMIS